MLGHRAFIGSRRNGDGAAVLRRRRHIDGIIADADAGDDAQLRIGREDARGVWLRAGQRRLDARQKRQQFLFGQLRSRVGVNEFKTGLTQCLDERALQTGQRHGRHQNFIHRRNPK